MNPSPLNTLIVIHFYNAHVQQDKYWITDDKDKAAQLADTLRKYEHIEKVNVKDAVCYPAEEG
jgi:hypothetical protein